MLGLGREKMVKVIRKGVIRIIRLELELKERGYIK